MRPHLHPVVRVFVIFALAAVPSASAQTSRVGFTAITATDLDATDVVDYVAGDFNNDGHLDLMLTAKGGSTFNVKLLAGSGTGSFSHAGGFSFADASAVTTADFNGDGALDVAVTQDVLSKQNSGYSDFVCGSVVGVAIFFGPTMAAGRCLATVPRGIAVLSGDFDRDDRPDLAVVSASGHGLVIYSELNFVTHTVKVTNVVEGRLSATSMARPIDVNRDGILDLVIGHAAGVTVLLGNGDGTFRIGGNAGSTNRTQAVAVGDLNKDGIVDVASIEGAGGGLHVGFGTGDGTFSTQVIATFGADLSDVAIEDLDRDGQRDVIVTHEVAGTVAILFGNGDGTFVSSPAVVPGVASRSLVVRDLDEDGDLDLGVFDAGVNGLNAQLWIALQDGRITTDTTPPIVTLTSPLAGSVVSGVAAVTAVASDEVGVTQVEFVANGQTLGRSAGPIFSVSWDTTNWPNGPVTLSARAIDAAHNESLWSAVQVTVNNALASDTTPPIVTVQADAAVEATGPAGAAFSFTASATDDVDGSVPVTCEPASGSTFPLGTTTVTCAASDWRGNRGMASFTVTVSDTSPPALISPADATVEASGPDGASVSFSASATDVVDGPVAVNCDRVNGAMFPLGVTRLTCTATDSRQNATSASFTVSVTDTTGPQVGVPADAVLEATGPAGAAFTFEASGSDVVDGSVAVSCNPASGATFMLGITTVACSATDVRGNRSSASFAVTVQDTTAPIVTVPTSATIEATEAAGAPFIYTASATDSVDGVVAVSCSPVSGSIFVIGATTVTCTATDAHGNARSAAFAVTVTDTTAPLVAVPADQTVEATSSAGATFSFIVTAIDRVGGNVSAGCVPVSGSPFPFGPTTVTCTATDAHGNSGTAAFVVTVQDTTPPSVTVPGNATIEATAPTGAVFNYIASATDLVDTVVAVQCTMPSGSMFPIGTTPVTCTASDAHGNKGTASFAVTVTDPVTSQGLRP